MRAMELRAALSGRTDGGYGLASARRRGPVTDGARTAGLNDSAPNANARFGCDGGKVMAWGTGLLGASLLLDILGSVLSKKQSSGAKKGGTGALPTAGSPSPSAAQKPPDPPKG